MSAGYIQLAALGQQDAYLTGEPQVTYFSGMYKRHTPFVLEAYDIAFNDQFLTYGGTSICRIPPKGDLIRGLTLKMILPALYNPGGDWTWPLAPSAGNFPQLWFGLTDGTIIYAPGSFNVPYYSTNGYTTWASSFFPTYGTYNSNTNYFSFSYSSGSVGLSNVIVPSTFTNTPTNAGSSVFWGFDPLGYSYTDAYGNLVYTATSNTVVPALTLQQSGWVQTAGQVVNTLTGFYIALINPFPLTSSVQYLNLNKSISNKQLFTIYDSTGIFQVSAGGTIIFNTIGYYVIRAGFNLDVGSVMSLSYSVSGSDNITGTIPSTFAYTQAFTVSPTPSSPAIIPILVTNSGAYYSFYVKTSSAGNFINGTYISGSWTNDCYQLSNNITLTNSNSQYGSRVRLYGNTSPLNSTVSLTPTSNLNFSIDGQYIVTGVLSVSNAVTSNLTEVYVTNVTVGNTTSSYTYDLSQQGRNPTYAFSIPIVVSNTSNYFVNVATLCSSSNLLVNNSFFAVTQTGVTQSYTPGIVVPYNGILLQSNSTTLQTPLNLAKNFTSNGNSTAFVTVNPSGNLVFSNVGSYMITGVFNTTNFVSNIIIRNSSSSFLQYYNPTLGYSTSPPYTISVPFHISDNTASYGITVVTTPSGGLVQPGTFISVTPLASPVTAGNFGGTFAYYDSVGTLAIVNADLKVGGQTIQSLSGEYIEVWNELNVPYENQPGLQLLTGKYDTQTSVPPPGRTYYVNLPFYFYGNPELSLPIVALGRQDVEVWVTFNNFSNLTSISVTNPVLNATIITEYVYLSNPEIDWFQSHQLDYVITQCQYEQFILPQNFQTSIFKLKFNNPIKELFFIIQPRTNIAYDYSGNGLVSMGMSFNGEDVFLTSTTNNLYLGSLEPFLKHINFFSKPPLPQQQIFGRQFYMYSFSRTPFETTSSGQVNFSRIQQVLLELNIFNSQSNYPAKNFRIIALSQNILRIENGIAGIMFH